MSDRREYMRVYMREYRGRGYLNDLDEEAQHRGMSAAELARLLLKRIAEEDLFRAILDGKRL